MTTEKPQDSAVPAGAAFALSAGLDMTGWPTGWFGFSSKGKLEQFTYQEFNTLMIRPERIAGTDGGVSFEYRIDEIEHIRIGIALDFRNSPKNTYLVPQECSKA